MNTSKQKCISFPDYTQRTLEQLENNAASEQLTDSEYVRKLVREDTHRKRELALA